MKNPLAAELYYLMIKGFEKYEFYMFSAYVAADGMSKLE